MENVQPAPDEQAAAAATTPAAAEPKKPGVIEQAMASLRSKAALNAEITELRTERDTLAARVSELEIQTGTLNSKVEAFQADHARLEQALTEAAEERQTVDQAAAAKIAAVGIVPAQLPPAGQDAQDTADSLRDKLKTEKNPRERFRIQSRIEDLEATA